MIALHDVKLIPEAVRSLYIFTAFCPECPAGMSFR